MSLKAALRQSQRPVYNAFGVKVGSYDTLDALCQGRWYKFTGVTQPPPSQLYVRDFWGRRIPLSTQCVRSAQATARGGSILQPQPVTPGAAARAVTDANRAATGSPIAPSLDSLVAPPAPGGGLVLDQQQATTYALWGGLALLGVLIFSDGRRR